MKLTARDLLPPSLIGQIEAAVRDSRAALDDLADASHLHDDGSGPPLVVKYMRAEYGARYKAPGRPLRISDAVGFTWGSGTYVTPLCHPLSTAIYGRVGVVAAFDPQDWRAFDATDQGHQDLYLQWLMQQPLVRDALLTVHSAYWNSELRNEFRRQFRIDCVVFHPDERDSATVYTRPDDRWMAVADFRPDGRLQARSGPSSRFVDARPVILLEEEFLPVPPGLARRAVLQLGSPRASDADVVTAIRQAYPAGDQIRVSS